MNSITTWFSENKLVATLATIFTVGVLALGTLTYFGWSDFWAAQDDYSAKASELDALSHKAIFPSTSNLETLGVTLTKNQASLAKLTAVLGKYGVPSFGDIEKAKPQDQPQQFQDTLRKQVTDIRSLAANSQATLPAGFYLGLDQYENQLPKPEQVPSLSKQLTILSWIAKTLAAEKGLAVSDFSCTSPDAPPDKLPADNRTRPRVLPANPLPPSSTPYETVGVTHITLRCDQTAFRELVNAIASAPYFLVIEDLLVQNSTSEPPRRDAVDPATQTDTSADGSSGPHLTVIVGRESLNVSLKIRALDFSALQKQPKPSK